MNDVAETEYGSEPPLLRKCELMPPRLATTTGALVKPHAEMSTLVVTVIELYTLYAVLSTDVVPAQNVSPKVGGAASQFMCHWFLCASDAETLLTPA